MQSRVREGLRLERPACPPAFYAMLTRCWLTSADARPTFLHLRTELVQFAKAHQSSQALRDVGATLAKAGAEIIYVCPSYDFINYYYPMLYSFLDL